MQRPQPNEYNPYFQRYIDLVPEGDFITLFRHQALEAVHFFEQIPFEKHDYRYAAGKWTPKEVLMHLMDTERVMSYRALLAARGDSATPLHSMDENLFAANAVVNNRSMENLLQEFMAIRSSSILLLEHLTVAQTQLTGNALEHIFTPRSLGYIMAGHVTHHINVLLERYW